MATCNYCKSEGQHTGKCKCCGKVIAEYNGSFVYGPTESDTRPVEFTLTDKYILIRKISSVEGVQDKRKIYAFYDLCEIDHVVYPYYTQRFGKTPVFRIVNIDGTDFVLSFGLKEKVLLKIAQALKSVGLRVVEGNGVATICCENPFVDFESCVNRVSVSAAQFALLSFEQFVAPKIIALNRPQVIAQPQPEVPSLVNWESEWEKTVAVLPETQETPAEEVSEPQPEVPLLVNWESEWEQTVTDISEPVVEVPAEEAPEVATPSLVDWESEWEKTVAVLPETQETPAEEVSEPQPEVPSLVNWESEWEQTVTDISEPVVEVPAEEAPEVATPSLVDWESEWEKTVSIVVENPLPIENKKPEPMPLDEWIVLWETE